MISGCQEHPVVSQSLRKKQQWKSSRQSLYWALLNLLLALAVFNEIESSSISLYFDISHPLLKKFEYVLAVVFTLNVVVDVWKFLWPRLTSSPTEITPEQQLLLGIKNKEPGFRVSPVKPLTPGSQENNLIFNTSGLSNHSGLSSRSGSPSPGKLSLSVFYPNDSYQQSAYHSAFSRDSWNTSGYSPSSSFAIGERLDNSSGVRYRHMSPVQRSPGTISSTERITDEKALVSYLKEQEEKSYRSKLSSVDASLNNGSLKTSSFWNYNRSISGYSQVLRKYQYQVACRSPQSLTFHNLDDLSQEIPFSASEVFGKFGITDDDLTIWLENLRRVTLGQGHNWAGVNSKGGVMIIFHLYDGSQHYGEGISAWICLTVVNRLAYQMKEINSALCRIGCEDMQVGEVSVTTLKRLALTKAQFIPSLNVVVPYLDIGSNQEYIVKRIKDLSHGGCMSDYDWNGGGNYGKPWGEHLPTDAALIVHLFCTYLDSRLPADPKYPDGKTFTSQYFMKTPEKPNLQKPDNILLYQAKINPPHFNVVIGEDTWTLQKGRNNLFCAILLFLYHIKVQEHGMLGRVSLGVSGVNILWIMDKLGHRRGEKFHSPGTSNGL